METIAFNDLLLLKSLVEEVRDQTLSRSRQEEALRALEILEQSVEAGIARSRTRDYLGRTDPNCLDGNWLQPYIEAALARRLCVQITCGTCGSGAFKGGLVTLASDGRYDPRKTMPETLRKIALALTLVDPNPHCSAALEDFQRATMAIIYFLWSSSPGFDRWAPQLLNGSWAGKMLDRMRVHYGAAKNPRNP